MHLTFFIVLCLTKNRAVRVNIQKCDTVLSCYVFFLLYRKMKFTEKSWGFIPDQKNAKSGSSLFLKICIITYITQICQAGKPTIILGRNTSPSCNISQIEIEYFAGTISEAQMFDSACCNASTIMKCNKSNFNSYIPPVLSCDCQQKKTDGEESTKTSTAMMITSSQTRNDSIDTTAVLIVAVFIGLFV